MLKRAEHFQLSVDSLARYKTVKDIWKFLDSNTMAVPWISYSPAKQQHA